MGGSRRKFKRSHAKVRVGLPRKKSREFKPAFVLPEALAAEGAGWDAEGSVVKNYAAFGVVANPNLLGAHARGTPSLVQSAALQAPDVAAARAPVPEFEPIDTGSDLETDAREPLLSLMLYPAIPLAGANYQLFPSRQRPSPCWVTRSLAESPWLTSPHCPSCTAT